MNQIGYEELDDTIMHAHTLIINSTPLGMAPHTEVCPPIPYEFIQPGALFFRPGIQSGKNPFPEKAEAAGARIKNGSDMLVIQAEASWAIWNGRLTLSVTYFNVRLPTLYAWSSTLLGIFFSHIVITDHGCFCQYDRDKLFILSFYNLINQVKTDAAEFHRLNIDQ